MNESARFRRYLKNMKLIYLFLLSIMPGMTLGQELARPVSYSDLFKEHYSKVSSKELVFGENIPIENEKEIKSQMRSGSIVLRRTDGARIPYEDAKAYLTVRSSLSETIHIEVKYMRWIEVKWISERAFLIYRNIGHIAGIEEIYDILDRKWLLQTSVHYMK